MDEIGLKEIIRTGVRAVEDYRATPKAPGGAEPPNASIPEPETVLDRFVQVGLIALEYQVDSLWSHLMEGLLAVYRLALPEDRDSWKPPRAETEFIVTVTHRVMALGAAATRFKRFEYVRRLALQRPIEEWNWNHWIRYSVTLAARGELKELFKGKSLIGPAGEYIRRAPGLFGLFDQNQDTVVNTLCQFDFLNCVIVTAETSDIDSCYPNFGGYYEDRTLPMVHDLISGGQSRTAIPGIDNHQLSEILQALDKETRHAFFDISGWHGYDQTVKEFLKAHLGAR